MVGDHLPTIEIHARIHDGTGGQEQQNFEWALWNEFCRRMHEIWDEPRYRAIHDERWPPR
jgi:hypothetical protein